jgi:enoyl-[acyl-carrier-protein] reductase (NADH)
MPVDVVLPREPEVASGGALGLAVRAPERRLVTIEDVGAMAGLVSDLARNVTGSIAYVDAGYHVMS